MATIQVLGLSRATKTAEKLLHAGKEFRSYPHAGRSGYVVFACNNADGGDLKQCLDAVYAELPLLPAERPRQKNTLDVEIEAPEGTDVEKLLDMVLRIGWEALSKDIDVGLASGGTPPFSTLSGDPKEVVFKVDV